MRKLNFQLANMCKQNRDGSFSTQTARSRILSQSANELHDLGFRRMESRGLKQKHVSALVNHWTDNGLSSGTIKNRMAHLRWWAGKINKPGVIANNNQIYGIPDRKYVTNIDKGKSLDARVNDVRDTNIKVSLKLQAAFGLRREESIKFQPKFADRGESIVLKSSWTKGGKEREIPIHTDEQRAALKEAHIVAGRGSLIPANKKYIDQLKVYENNTAAVGLSKLHGLRHNYAQTRYEAITGWKSPVKGGLRRFELDEKDKEIDANARLLISKELGHERLEVVSVYLGS